VWRHAQRGYWRASKSWCKTLPEALVDKALQSFAHNGVLQGGGGAPWWGAVAGQAPNLLALNSTRREGGHHDGQGKPSPGTPATPPPCPAHPPIDADHGLRASDVYCAALPALRELRAWFALQREFAFYSSSLLLLYEGDAAGGRALQPACACVCAFV
jgi:hypothetical protein